MKEETCEIDDRKTLDNLASVCCNREVVRATQVANALSQQAKYDRDRIDAIDAEQDKIRNQHQRFLDLEAEKKDKSARLRRTASLIPNHLQNIGVTGHDNEHDPFEMYVVAAKDLTLWEAMLALLEHTGEIQLYELQHLLEQFGKKVTRGAIESAILTHPKMFRANTRNRERVVSLKR